ncbi:MAG: helix-turn-helix domain-containing protein [Gemmataceae bacterium]
MAKRRKRMNEKKAVGCPVETTIEAIGGRWKVLVIHHLLEGTKRFGELTRLLRGISARTLTRQLRELADSGVIERHVYQQIPPRVDYSLTPLGCKLAPILYAMHDWGLEAEKSRSRS